LLKADRRWLTADRSTAEVLRMTRYILRRIILLVPTLFGVTLLVFFMIRLAPGTILDQCSAAVRAEFGAASLILAKGQANYETLSDCDRDVFFLLQVKCPVIAQHVGVPIGSMVIVIK